MDALRATAMLLGIVFHTAVFLVPVPEWPVYYSYAESQPRDQNLYAYLITILHGFRMPLFFLISGFFTAFVMATARPACAGREPAQTHWPASGSECVDHCPPQCLAD